MTRLVKRISISVCLGLVLEISAAVAQPTTAPGRAAAAARSVDQRMQVVDYSRRETAAPAPIRSRLSALRSEVEQKRLTFTIGYTTAMDIPLEKLAGTRAPQNLSQLAERQNALAAKLL